MICKVKNTIEKHGMLSGIKSVAVGVSGGADSMCLIDILSRIKDEYGITLKAVHINHNIRGAEALSDAEHVKTYCKKNGVEFLLFNVDVPSLSKKLGISEEECGRKVRYDCFAKAGCDAVATAHTMSDSVETVIFNLARGTGSKGLTGIPATRKPNIIRPLIDCTRAEIEKYCKDNYIAFVTDSTNLTDDYKRNYIRHNIVPALSEINASAVNAVAKSAEILSEESDFIQNCAYDLLREAAGEDGYLIRAFLSAHSAVRKRALRILLGERMSKTVEYKHVILSEEVIMGIRGKAELSENIFVSVQNDKFLVCENDSVSDSWLSDITDNTFRSPYAQYKFVRSENPNGIDMDKIKNKLVATSRKDGDRIYIKKRKITKSLKKAFNEMKIPATVRNEIAVLRDGENIVWVEGIGTDGNYLPDKNSKNVFSVIKDVGKNA